MRTITYEELKDILAKHKKWLNDEDGGEKANLSAANLSGLNLANVNLQYANLHHVNLQDAFCKVLI